MVQALIKAHTGQRVGFLEGVEQGDRDAQRLDKCVIVSAG